MEGPVLLHVMTKKGKSYAPAEEQPDKFHGVGPFEVRTGEVNEPKKKDTYTDVFGKVLCDAASDNKKGAAAYRTAMADGTRQKALRICFQTSFCTWDCEETIWRYICGRTCSRRNEAGICGLFLLSAERL